MAINNYSGPEEVEPRPNVPITPDVQEELVWAAIDRVGRPDFAERYARLETRDAGNQLAELDNRPKANASKQVGQMLRGATNAVMEEVGYVGANGAMPEWQQTYQGLAAYPHPESELPMRQHWRGIFEQHHRSSGEFARERESLIETQNAEYLEAYKRALAVHEELIMSVADARFWHAVDAWANTPDSKGGVGVDGRGFNGGIMHYIEYWAERHKRRRFTHLDVEMSVRSLAEHTEEFYPYLVRTEHNRDGRNAVLIDSSGNERFYLLRPGGEFIVGISLAGDERRRITSIIPDSTVGYFERVVANCLAGNDRGVLNKLGPDVTLVYPS